MIQGTVVDGEDEEDDVVPVPAALRSPPILKQNNEGKRYPLNATTLPPPVPPAAHVDPITDKTPSQPASPVGTTAPPVSMKDNLMGRLRTVSDAIKAKMASPPPSEIKLRFSEIATTIEATRWVPTRAPQAAHKMAPSNILRAPPCASDEALDAIRYGNEKLHAVVRLTYDKPIASAHLVFRELSSDITLSHRETDRARRSAAYTAQATKCLAASVMELKFF